MMADYECGFRDLLQARTVDSNIWGMYFPITVGHSRRSDGQPTSKSEQPVPLGLPFHIPYEMEPCRVVIQTTLLPYGGILSPLQRCRGVAHIVSEISLRYVQSFLNESDPCQFRFDFRLIAL